MKYLLFIFLLVNCGIDDTLFPAKEENDKAVENGGEEIGILESFTNSEEKTVKKITEEKTDENVSSVEEAENFEEENEIISLEEEEQIISSDEEVQPSPEELVTFNITAFPTTTSLTATFEWGDHPDAEYFSLFFTSDPNCEARIFSYNVIPALSKTITFSSEIEGYVCVQAIKDIGYIDAKNTGQYFRVGEWNLADNFSYTLENSFAFKNNYSDFDDVKQYGVEFTESLCLGAVSYTAYKFEDGVLVDVDSATIGIYDIATWTAAGCIIP